LRIWTAPKDKKMGTFATGGQIFQLLPKSPHVDPYAAGFIPGLFGKVDPAVKAEPPVYAPAKPAPDLTKAQAKMNLISSIKNLSNSEVMVSNAEGKQENAWKIVSGFVTDLSAQAIKTDDMVADPSSQERIQQIFRSLIKKEVGSAKVLGPAGTGKTTLIKQMISELAAGRGPEALQNTAFLMIDPAALSSGTKFVGTMDTKIGAMLALSREFKIVWVVDEAHTLRGAGAHSGNSNDIMQLLKAGLTEGYFRMIGLSTDHEWNAAFAGDPALNQRFGEVKLTEPAGDALRVILSRWMKKHSFPEMEPKVLDMIINLSSEFNAEGAQPRKGTLLIEEIFAEQSLKGTPSSPSSDEVKTAAQRLYNLHLDHFDRAKMRARLDNMPKALSQSVIGQISAKNALVDAVTLSIAGMEDKNKPKGRKIFAGPKGQGKTELIMAFGKAMELPVARIVMTKYTSAHQTEELKREIAQALRRNALSVLFFDEIEKAHPSIQKDLLDVLDSGRFTVTEKSNGGSSPITVDVNVRNAYVFMATNAGANYIDTLPEKAKYNAVDMRASMHQDGLNDLVLDRMDGVVPFFYLSRQEYRQVIVTQIRSILSSYRKNNAETQVTLENLRGFIDQTVKDSFREKMSNREALTTLSENLRLRIAKTALAAADPSKVKVELPGERTNRFQQNGMNGLTCPRVFSAPGK
jgi:ATP-dependent Clp protease ATP-binding subunit ClpA